ncbi:MAG: hypothetical protein ACT4PG_12525, partial [Panacagrimonas sp.]
DRSLRHSLQQELLALRLDRNGRIDPGKNRTTYITNQWDTTLVSCLYSLIAAAESVLPQRKEGGA